MNRWLQTLSTRPVDVDVSGVEDVDDWIERLRETAVIKSRDQRHLGQELVHEPHRG